LATAKASKELPLMALLEVDDLRLEYTTERGPLRAVDGISFSLDGQGEALGIIGESGSGKTSLAIALMRLLPRNGRLTGGSIRLDGIELTTLPEDELRSRIRWRRMAMVFQGAMHSLNPVVRVGDQVGERLVADGVSKREAKARTADLLVRVGLSSATASRYPHELSGGMKQRVMIASALTNDPPLLLLDEPTSALDVSIQAQIMNLLKDLRDERGMSMLFITHDLALASDLCDRIAVVYAGQIREIGSAEDVLRHPQDPYTQRLLASIPRLHEPQAPAFLPGAPPDLRDELPGCRFVARCPVAFEPCPHRPPPLFEPRPGQLARCWHHASDAEATWEPPHAAAQPRSAAGEPPSAVAEPPSSGAEPPEAGGEPSDAAAGSVA
jgi:oligopeptide/dipeptide ABC transporter ATP-binding protein